MNNRRQSDRRTSDALERIQLAHDLEVANKLIALVVKECSEKEALDDPTLDSITKISTGIRDLVAERDQLRQRIELYKNSNNNYECTCVNCRSIFLGEKEQKVCVKCLLDANSKLNQRIEAADKQLNPTLKSVWKHGFDSEYLSDIDECQEIVISNSNEPCQIPAADKTLSVWYGSMPETNGKTNWTAILHAGDIVEGHTIDRSEYPDRVRYAADCVRYLIGELKKRPFILDYDSTKCSTTAEPKQEGYALIPVDRDGYPKITNSMKASCHGEFYIDIEFPEWDADEECFTHEMELQKRDIPWDTIKKIYKAMASVVIQAADGKE